MPERDRSELYPFVFEACADGVIVYEIDENDAPSDILEVNPALCTMLGYSKSELLAMNVLQLVPPQSPGAKGDYIRLLLNQKSIGRELIYLSKTGERIPVEAHARLREVDNRRMVVTIIRDIRERKHMEQALERNLSLEASHHDAARTLNALLDVAPLAIYTFNDQNRITSWNTTAEKVFGWSAAEVLGAPNPSALEGESASLFHVLMSGGLVEGMEFARKRKDGSLVDVSIWGAALHNDAGVSIGTIAFAIDVTDQRRVERMLSETQRRMNDVLQSIDLFLWSFDLELDKVTFCAGGLEETLGIAAEELLRDSKNVVGLIHPDDMHIFQESVVRIRAGEAFQSEHRLITPKGGIRWVQSHGRPFYDANGVVRRIDSVTIDITDRKNSQLESQETQHRYESLLNLMPDSVIVHREGIVRYANDATRRMLGLTVSPVGRSVWDFFPESARPGLAARFHSADSYRENVIPCIQHSLVRADGTEFPVETVSVLIRDNGETSILSVTKDISLQVETERELRILANHDPLTGLPNRRYFMEQLDQLMAASAQDPGPFLHVVLFLDMDRFKHINDTYGHGFGDQALKEMARRLQECLPEKAFLSRFGGDEFAILYPHLTDEHPIAVLCERIIGRFSEAFQVMGKEFFITPSIGLALYPLHGLDRENLLKHADAAMYSAKANGGNCARFYQEEQWMERLLGVETDLKKALEKSEFVVHYQPKFRLDTGVIYGVEALVRWSHPERGLIPPGEFIPVAEECGAIVPLGEWVLREACQQSVEWQRKGYTPILVSVNVSPKQFRTRNMLEVIQDVLEESQLDPKWLMIEITEGLLMDHPTEMASILQQIRALGVGVAIDDFGTGYSSLAYLRKFNPSQLKIDQSFVDGMLVDDGAKSIVNAVISLAHNLGMQVVAEGVETEAQMRYLRSEGADMAQGYYFSTPIDSKAVERQFLRSAVMEG